MHITFASALFIALFSAQTFAKTVILAGDGEFAPVYNRVAPGLLAGDTIELNDRKFKLQAFLGSGNMSYVWSLGEGKAIRIPKSYTPVLCENLLSFQDGVPAPEIYENVYGQVANNYYQTALKLHELGAPVVKVFPEESQPPFYIVVEQLNIEMLLTDWLSKGDREDPEIKADWDRLLERMKTIAALNDLKGSSIAYVRGRGWVLIDFGGPAQAAKPGEPSAYDQLKIIAEEMLSER